MTENNNIKPSEEKVWKKYLPEGAVDVDIARCTAFEYLRDNNADNLGGKAIHYYGKSITFREMISTIAKYSDAFDAVGQINISQPRTAVKGTVVNFFERRGKFNPKKFFTFKKCVSSDFRNGITHKKFGQMVAIGKCVRLQNFHAVCDTDFFQKGTLHESARTDRTDGHA